MGFTSNQDRFQKLTLTIFIVLLLILTILPKWSSILIVLLVVLWFMGGNWRDRLSYFKRNPVFLVLPVFYLLHLFSLTYSTDLDTGFKKLESLLTLMLIPIVFPTLTSVISNKNVDKIKWAYILGITFNFFFCLVRSTSLFFYELYCKKNGIELESYPYTNYFFYSYLSFFMHYGYMAMYVNVAILFLLKMVIHKNFNKYRNAIYLLIALLSIYVLMLYSKAGMLALFAIYIYFSIYQLKKLKNVKGAIWTGLTIVVLAFVTYNYIPYTKERVQGMVDGIRNKDIDPNSHESTQLRIFVWKSASQLIKENWQFGFGLGDANQELLESYKRNGFMGAYEEDLNAHNQFLQTFLNVGILGFLTLMLFLVWNFYIGLRKSSFLLQAFVILMFIAFLTESYLQTQKGIFFISVLATLILIMEKKSKRIGIEEN